MAPQTKLTADQIGDQGEAIYQDRLREQVEPGNIGRYLALDIDSREYEVGDAHRETVYCLRARVPTAEIFTVLIGYPAIGAFGTRLLPTSQGV